MKAEFRIESIGIIRSGYTTKEETPIQGAFKPDGEAVVEIFDDYADGLQDVETFSHIFLIYVFDRAGPVQLVRLTFLDDKPHGVFASRHPSRPSGLGLTVVRLVKREGNLLHVSGIDVLDGTPLVDIKPYIRRFDSFPEASEGWAADKTERPKPAGRE